MAELQGQFVGDNLQIFRNGAWEDQHCYGSYPQCNAACSAYVAIKLKDKDKDKYEKEFAKGMAKNVDVVQQEYPDAKIKKKVKPDKPKPGETSWLKLCTGTLVQIS